MMTGLPEPLLEALRNTAQYAGWTDPAIEAQHRKLEEVSIEALACELHRRGFKVESR